MLEKMRLQFKATEAAVVQAAKWPHIDLRNLSWLFRNLHESLSGLKGLIETCTVFHRPFDRLQKGIT